MEKQEIRRYKCIKECMFEKCDDDGFSIDSEYMFAEVGSIWHESPYMISGGKDNVHLDREGGYNWCEPLRDTLSEYFERIESVYC